MAFSMNMRLMNSILHPVVSALVLSMAAQASHLDDILLASPCAQFTQAQSLKQLMTQPSNEAPFLMDVSAIIESPTSLHDPMALACIKFLNEAPSTVLARYSTGNLLDSALTGHEWTFLFRVSVQTRLQAHKGTEPYHQFITSLISCADQDTSRFFTLLVENRARLTTSRLNTALGVFLISCHTREIDLDTDALLEWCLKNNHVLAYNFLWAVPPRPLVFFERVLPFLRQTDKLEYFDAALKLLNRWPYGSTIPLMHLNLFMKYILEKESPLSKVDMEKMIMLVQRYNPSIAETQVNDELVQLLATHRQFELLAQLMPRAKEYITNADSIRDQVDMVVLGLAKLSFEAFVLASPKVQLEKLEVFPSLNPSEYLQRILKGYSSEAIDRSRVHLLIYNLQASSEATDVEYMEEILKILERVGEGSYRKEIEHIHNVIRMSRNLLAQLTASQLRQPHPIRIVTKLHQ